MSNTTRESGFYWVKIKEGWPWTAMLFLHGCWHIAIDAEHAFEKMKDEQLFAINETRIPDPDEQQAQREVQKARHKEAVIRAYRSGEIDATRSIFHESRNHANGDEYYAKHFQ